VVTSSLSIFFVLGAGGRAAATSFRAASSRRRRSPLRNVLARPLPKLSKLHVSTHRFCYRAENESRRVATAEADDALVRVKGRLRALLSSFQNDVLKGKMVLNRERIIIL